eukprot:jgi/Bigna1/79212/fgenesh1_pg.60_\
MAVQRSKKSRGGKVWGRTNAGYIADEECEVPWAVPRSGLYLPPLLLAAWRISDPVRGVVSKVANNVPEVAGTRVKTGCFPAFLKYVFLLIPRRDEPPSCIHPVRCADGSAAGVKAAERGTPSYEKLQPLVQAVQADTADCACSAGSAHSTRCSRHRRLRKAAVRAASEIHGQGGGHRVLADAKVLISTLYLGTDDKAQRLIQDLREALSLKPKLTVTLLVDAHRTLRGPSRAAAASPVPAAAAADKGEGRPRSVPARAHDGNYSQLKALVSEFGVERVSCFLFPAPPYPSLAPPRWIVEKLGSSSSSRLNELRSVYHAKLYIFDNSVILSGANLSDVYFTTRQDRYVRVRDRKLTDFYSQVVRCLCSASPRIEASIDDDSCGKRTTTKGREDAAEALTPSSSCSPPPQLQDYSLSENRLSLLRDELCQLFSPGAATHRNEGDNNGGEDDSPLGWTDDDHEYAHIFPSIEYGWCGLHLDSEAVVDVLSLQSPSSSTTSTPRAALLAAGYLNPTRNIVEAMLKWGPNGAFLGGALNANGWYGASGLVTRHVPSLYRSRMLEIAEEAKERRAEIARDGGGDKAAHDIATLSVLEWSRLEEKGQAEDAVNWSFHSKGGESMRPFLTTAGSSNYNFRSVHRDLEVQAFILTANPALRSTLTQEVMDLCENAEPVRVCAEDGSLFQSLIVRRIARLVASVL